MYITLLNVNKLKRIKILELIDHIFEFNGNRDYLYSIKDFGEFHSYYILTKTKPVNLSGDFEVKILSLDSSYFEHNYYSFEIDVNPTVKKNNKIIALFSYDDVFNWFKRKAMDSGFSFNDNVEINSSSVSVKNSDDSYLNLGKSTIRGVLKIENKEIFVDSFFKGIGRSKTFGFGLLKIKPIN